MGAYLWYFIENIILTVNVTDSLKNSDLDSLMVATRTTLMSYNNLIIIISAALYVFVHTLISLTKSSMFMTNILPYSKKEILLAQKVFRLGIAFISFELIMLMVLPLWARLEFISIADKVLVLTLFHSIFVATYLLVDCIYCLVSNYVIKSNILSISTTLFILDIVVTSFCAIYFIQRFKVEYIVGNIDMNISSLIYVFLLVSSIVILILVYLINKYELNVPVYKKISYGMWKLPMIRLRLMIVFPAIYRHKSFIQFIFLITAFAITIFLYNFNIEETLYVIANLSFLGVFPAIYYVDATVKVRKFYEFYRISVSREVISLIMAGLILSSPPLLVSLYLGETITGFLTTLSVYFLAVVAGLLFPSAQGNLNEVAATSVTGILALIIYFITSQSNIYISILVIVVLVFMMTIFLKKERNL